MAMKLFLLPIFSLILLAATVSARPGIPFHPCNTLIISTYSFSLHPQNPNHPINSNPNLNPEFVFMDLGPARRFRHHHLHLHLRPRIPVNHLPRLHSPLRRTNFIPAFVYDKTEIPHRSEITDLPLGFSSMKERTKDILSVVASLLFGAACGALTAGTMYLIWSIVSYRHGNYRSLDGFTSDAEDDDDNDDIFNPKKSHYVAIPAAAPVNEKVADAATAAVVAKETA